MRLRGLMTLVVCLLVAGAGATRLSAKSQGITVTVNNLGCTTAAGAGSFDVRSWSWGATNTPTAPGSGGGSGKAVLSALTMTRTADACSPKLLEAVVLGRHFTTLTLTQYDDKGAATAMVVLTDVLFSSWQIGGTNTSAETVEEVEASFGKFTYTDVTSGNSFTFDLNAQK